MTNMIQADFYRTVRSKGFWINQFLLFALLIVTLLTKVIGTVGNRSEETSKNLDASMNTVWTASKALVATSSMSTFICYFVIILFTVIVGYDLTHGTLKNLLSSGVSRFNYFFSKYVIFLLMSALQFVFYYGLVFIFAGLKNGFGTFEGNYWSKFFQAISLQYLSMQAIFVVALVVLYLINSNVGAVITTIVVPLFPSLLSMLLPKIKVIQYFDFQSNMGSAITFSGSTYTNALFAAIATIIICCAGAFYLFKKKDF